jgi:hypothetical protein
MAKLSASGPADLEARQAGWRNLIEFVDRHADSRWVFRGVGSATKHLLLPKIGRPELGKYSAPKERVIFRSFKRRAAQHVGRAVMSDWEWLALAQHHGLPTRLLDWTTNPLIAAYFAVASAPDTHDGKIYAVRIGTVIDTENGPGDGPFATEGVSFLIPPASVTRIAAQRGLFTVHARPGEAWQPADASEHVVPRPHRSFFRRKLFYLGIEPGHIMADLDGLCQTLEWQYRNGIAVGPTGY